MKDGYKRYCDRCGVLLDRNNNKRGFEICDKCNEELERSVKRMTIDDAIKYYLNKNIVLTEEEALANTIALNTMRKYQKIVQIMERTVDDGTSMYDTLQEIEEVVEDGNDD